MQTVCLAIGHVCDGPSGNLRHKYTIPLISFHHLFHCHSHIAHSEKMAILRYTCVTCAATPMSPESPTPPPPLPAPRQTKIILPNKKPMKWSTGVAPGDYGGPPTTTTTKTKLRKYWGGDDEDPLASDDFMWNKDFMGRFKRLIQEPQPSIQPSPAKVSTLIHFTLTLNHLLSGCLFLSSNIFWNFGLTGNFSCILLISWMFSVCRFLFDFFVFEFNRLEKLKKPI